MAKSTGPILALGGIEFANKFFADNGYLDFRIIVATGIAAGGLYLVEKIPGMEPIAVGIAWIALVTLMFSGIAGNPPPVQTLKKMVAGL